MTQSHFIEDEKKNALTFNEDFKKIANILKNAKEESVRIDAGEAFLNLFKKHIKNKELPRYIEEKHIEIFVSSFPALVKSINVQLGPYLIGEMFEIKKIRNMFLHNEQIKRVMLHLPSNTSTAVLYESLLFPYLKKEKKNTIIADNKINLDDFKSSCIVEDAENNQITITINHTLFEKFQTLLLAYPDYLPSFKKLKIHMKQQQVDSTEKLFSILKKLHFEEITLSSDQIINNKDIENAVNQNKITSPLNLNPILEKIKSEHKKLENSRTSEHKQKKAELKTQIDQFNLTLEKVHSSLLRNQRELNKEKLKTLITDNEKNLLTAKEIINEVSGKFCEILSFKEFNTPQIYTAFIELLQAGYTKEKLKNEFFSFLQIKKPDQTTHMQTIFQREPFSLAYRKFLQQNKAIISFQLKFITTQKKERWQNACNIAKETLKLQEKNKTYTEIDLSNQIISALSYDIPHIDQLADKKYELSDIANMLLMYIGLNSNTNMLIDRLLKLNLFNIVNIDNLINQLRKQISLIQETLQKPPYTANSLENIDNILSELDNKLNDLPSNQKTLLSDEKRAIEEKLKTTPEDGKAALTQKITKINEKYAALPAWTKKEGEEAQALRLEITKRKEEKGQIFAAIGIPLQATNSFHVLQTILENLQKEKIRLKKLAEHPYKINTAKQDFQMQQQQQQQHNVNLSENKSHSIAPPDLVSDEKEQLNTWLGKKDNRTVKTMTQTAFDILNNPDYKHLLEYGLPLKNLPKGFYINSTHDEKNPFLDYDAKSFFQQNENLLTQQLPTDNKSIPLVSEKKDYTIEDDKIRQFGNEKIAKNKQDLTFTVYVKEIIETKRPNNEKFTALLNIEKSQDPLTQPKALTFFKQNIIDSFTPDNLTAASKLIYTYGNDGIEFLSNKINNISNKPNGKKTSTIFIEKFLNKSHDWNEFTTPSMAAALNTLALLTPPQLEWWNTLIEQHNEKIGTSFPDLVNAFKYFIDQFQFFTKENDLPNICSLTDVTNMKTGLTRYVDILSKDPTKRPIALDIDTYNILQKEIAHKKIAASTLTPEKKSHTIPNIEEKKAIPKIANKKKREEMDEEEKRTTLKNQFQSDLNAEDIINGIRHLNINPSIHSIEKHDVEEKYIEKFIAEDTDKITAAEEKNIEDTDEIIDDEVVINQDPQDLRILEKMSLAEAYFKINSWGHESSKTIKNLQNFIAYPITEDMKNILIKEIGGPDGKALQTLLQTQIKITFPISLYDLTHLMQEINNITVTIPKAIKDMSSDELKKDGFKKLAKLINMNIGKNPSYDAIVATIPKSVKDMTPDELKKYAAECRKKIQELTKLNNKTEEKSESRTEVEIQAAKKQLIDTKLFYLSLLREGLYRADPKSRFANSTQILSVINETILNEGNSFAQIGTGQGKSLITALIAAMLSAEGNTVDIITSDPHLANEGVKEFHEFYKFFGIPCADRPIESEDYFADLPGTGKNPSTEAEKNPSKCTYKKGGINYSDITSMSVFRSRMQLKSKDLYFAGPVSAILDEADYIAEFPTTIRYVKSSNQDVKSKHAWVYKLLNDFIDNPDYKNIEHINNKREYLIDQAIEYIKKHTDETIIADLKKDKIDVLEKAQIDKWLAAAWNAKYIAETGLDKTFKIATKHINGNDFFVVHHIINNKESEHAQLMDGGQQFLHARMQSKLGAFSDHSFWFEAENPALTSVKSIDFIEYYRNSTRNPGGKIKGHTGFIGDPAQLDVIARRHNIQSTSYPNHQRKQRIDDQGIFLDEKSLDAEIFLQILQMIKERRPVLLLCKNAEEARKMAEKVKQLKKSHANMSSAKINLHTAIDKKLMDEKATDFTPHQMDENETLDFANEDCTITISDASLGRGKDFKPKHPEGLHVILNYLGTQADIEQGIGRAGRQGSKGSSFHGVTMKELLGFTIPHKLPLNTKHKNKKISDANRIQIADALTDAREEISKQLQTTSLFDEALTNISRYFAECYLERKYENEELDDQTYKNFLSIKDKIWKDTIDKNVDTHTKEELKFCFDSALEKIWDNWPFHPNVWTKSQKESELELAKKQIVFPIRKVEASNFFADLSPAMGAVNFSSIGLELPVNTNNTAITENTFVETHQKQKTLSQKENLFNTATPNSTADITTHFPRGVIKNLSADVSPQTTDSTNRSRAQDSRTPRTSVSQSRIDTVINPSNADSNIQAPPSRSSITISKKESYLFENQYQLLKNNTLDFRSKERLPNHQVLSYAYRNIISEQNKLGMNLSFTPLTINIDNACLFEAHVLICKTLNIKIDNKSPYLTCEPTDKQRAYLEKFFNITSPQSEELVTIKKQAQSLNKPGAFNKKSTLPLSELDLALIKTYDYLQKEKISDKNIANLSADSCQLIIDELQTKQSTLKTLSEKTRLMNEKNPEHINEEHKRQEYKTLVEDLLKLKITNLIKQMHAQKIHQQSLSSQTSQKEAQPTRQPPIEREPTVLKEQALTQREPTDLKEKTFIQQNTHLIYLKDYQFVLAKSNVNIERKLLDDTQYIKNSPTDMHIGSTPDPVKHLKQVKNIVKTNVNTEPCGTFIEDYRDNSYQIVNQSIQDKGYQTIKNKLFGNTKIPTESTLMCAYSQLLAIKKAFEGKGSPLIEITTKDPCLFQAYILIFKCKPNELFSPNELTFINKTKFTFSPSKEQIHYTKHFFTFAENQKIAQHSPTFFSSMFQPNPSGLIEQKLKTFITAINKTETNLTQLQENLKTEKFTEAQIQTMTETLATDKKTLTNLVTQLKAYNNCPDVKLANKIQKNTETASQLLKQINKTIQTLEDIPTRSLRVHL